MTTTLQFRRYTTAELSSLTGAVGELIVDTDKDTITVHDSSTAGGIPLATESAVSAKQDTLVSGTNIKTINGTSLLGSGDVTIDLSAVGEDILPSFTEVYDIGSTDNRWFDVYASNSVNIGGSAVTGNEAGIVIDTLLAGDLLVTQNLITPDVTSARAYTGDLGWLTINGNLDVDGDMLQLPVAISGVTPDVVTENLPQDYSKIDLASSPSVGFGWFVFNFLENGETFGPGYELYTQIQSSSNNVVLTFNFIDYGGDPTVATAVVSPSNVFYEYITRSGAQYWALGIKSIEFTSGVTTFEDIAFNGASPDNGTIATTLTIPGSGVPILATGDEGSVRYNKDLGFFEGYNGIEWKQLVYADTVTALQDLVTQLRIDVDALMA